MEGVVCGVKTALGMTYVLAVFSVAVMVSHLLALAGEPQSEWLWCTVIGAC